MPPEGATAIQDLLAAALHLGVVALYRAEVERFIPLARAQGGCGAASQTDEHRGSAEDDDLGPGRDGFFVDMLQANAPESPGQHDWFMIASHFTAAGQGLLVGAEISAQGRSSELVVERRGADGPLQHDVQGRCEAAWMSVVAFPGLYKSWDLEVRDRESDQSGLGLGTAPGGAFIADLAARPSGGPGKG
ncbi:MAG: hypothetical protein USCGTAYLOR_01371 [Chromatiales bacterium USCg_Taylor]|nr:MAG: hypothetical protein USCGTAYLOR_01371 [Chromatiales bacterium USCg_Taylor]